MNALKFLILLVFFKFNFSIAAEPLPFNNIVLHKNPLQVSQVKFKDFYLKDIEVNKNDGKIKVINFWATWCEPCRKEMPSLDNFSYLNKHILIYPVNLEKPNTDKTRKFYRDLNLKNLKIYFDPEFELTKQFKLRGVPTTILFNKENKEFARVIGSIDFTDEKFLNWIKQYN